MVYYYYHNISLYLGSKLVYYYPNTNTSLSDRQPLNLLYLGGHIISAPSSAFNIKVCIFN
jgi:hypothetical protein